MFCIFIVLLDNIKQTMICLKIQSKIRIDFLSYRVLLDYLYAFYIFNLTINLAKIL